MMVLSFLHMQWLMLVRKLDWVVLLIPQLRLTMTVY